MQLVVARVVAAGTVASEMSARASLEAARQSTEGRAISAETAAAAAVTERDSLASRLALSEAEIEKLRVAAVAAKEVAERAKTAAAIEESAAREASQTAAREKAALEAKVSELESDLRTTTMDLATTRRQVSQTTNQLQVVTEEASRFQSLLTDKTRIHLRSTSVRTYTFFTTGFPRFLSIRGARGLLALNQALI
jgi:hypothetical protein